MFDSSYLISCINVNDVIRCVYQSTVYNPGNDIILYYRIVYYRIIAIIAGRNESVFTSTYKYIYSTYTIMYVYSTVMNDHFISVCLSHLFH